MPATLPVARRAWMAKDLGDRAAWTFPLSDGCLAALAETVRRPGQPPRMITDLTLDAGQAEACRPCLAPVRAALEAEPGFAVMDRIPPGRFTPEEATACYWLLGQALGEPFAQNVQGTLLYDVRDLGQDVRYGARFSVTNAESTFHTDNSFGAEVLDYVGLLCLNPARSGGRSQLVSGHTIYHELRRQHPDLLETLCRPFHVDRRGGVRAGETPTAHVPVFERRGEELTVRYLRYWIHAGHDRAGEPLTAEQLRALDALDALLARPDLRVEFPLEGGQVLWVNNRWIFHNRTGFEDHAEPGRKRHLVRLWLRG
jgi:Taurine catabolism dioxygenase TauD, TfdA family